MNLLEIIEAGLKENGYAGLVIPGLCGCKIGDLSPANCMTEKCDPGYLHLHSVTKNWIISTSKNAKTDVEIQEIIDII